MTRETRTPAPVIEAVIEAAIEPLAPGVDGLVVRTDLHTTLNSDLTPPMSNRTGSARSGPRPPKPKPTTRASILVTRWHQGRDGGIDGESIERVSVPLARIELVEPYTQEIWIAIAQQQHGPGACRARLILKGGSDYMAVTETVEEIDRLMNTPVESDR